MERYYNHGIESEVVVVEKNEIASGGELIILDELIAPDLPSMIDSPGDLESFVQSALKAINAAIDSGEITVVHDYRKDNSVTK